MFLSLHVKWSTNPRMTSILATAIIFPWALPGWFQSRDYFLKLEVSTSIFCVLFWPRQSFHTVCFLIFASPTVWSILGIAVLPPPGWFQSSNRFSKPRPRVLVCESGLSDRSGPLFSKLLTAPARFTHKNSCCALPCLFRSLDYFWKPPRLLVELSCANPRQIIRPHQSLRTVHFRNSTRKTCNQPKPWLGNGGGFCGVVELF